MRNKKRYFLGIYLLIAASAFAATTHYVSLSGTNNSPYLNWADSATNIQWAVDKSTEGDTVMVSNGTYWVTGVITVASSLTIQGLKGRDITILKGFRPGTTYTNRCFNVLSTASTNIIDGFTITNFIAYAVNGAGGRIYGTIRNCIISGNSSPGGANGTGFGGGLGLFTGSLCSNCIVRGNLCAGGGGGVYIDVNQNATIVDSLIENNTGGIRGGGGVDSSDGRCTISNCVIINNTGCAGGGMYSANGPNYIDSCVITGNVVVGSATDWVNTGGGGISAGVDAYVNNCRIIGNTVRNSGGGISGKRCFLKNSVVANNQAVTNGGGLFISTGIVENCTVVSNYAGVSGGGVYINGPAVGTNNIVYHNTAGVANNFTNTTGNTGLNYCCVFPAVDGNGNITNNPVLKNLAGGDYHLNNNSPCINRGMNQSWMTGAVDLDGRTRIRYGTVDMGAYERIFNGGIYRFH